MNQEKKFFNENYNGILTHNGWVKVAKFNITAKILNVNPEGKNIQVKGKKGKGSYICDVHKNLIGDIKFLDVDDTVGIKWNMGKPYVVGYRKKSYDNLHPQQTGDKPVSENWTYFFDRMELGE